MNSLLGIGLRHIHYNEVMESMPDIGWLEIHSDNFFRGNQKYLDIIIDIAKFYPISLHGVGLSLGSASGVNNAIIQDKMQLIKLLNPIFISEHLSWSQIGEIYIPDLLPLPYNEESLQIVANNICLVQNIFNREILIENPSRYLNCKESDMNEVDFLLRLCKITGAKILLDITNLFVSANNCQFCPHKYIDQIPQGLVKEIHLAGHDRKMIDKSCTLLIDTHDAFVANDVWELYHYSITRFGAVHTLLEWDENIPNLNDLLQEIYKANKFLLMD